MRLLREHQVIKVQHPLGWLEISPVAIDHVYVRFSDLNLRGRRHYGHVRLANYLGSWGYRRLSSQLPGEGANITDSLWLKDALHHDVSDLAKRQFKLTLMPFIIDWINGHPEALKQAEQININNLIVAQKKKIEALQRDLKKAHDELEALEKREKDLK